jgi:hypothetical protein
MQRAVQRGLAKRDNDGLRYVGIDEKSFGHGQCEDRRRGLRNGLNCFPTMPFYGDSGGYHVEDFLAVCIFLPGVDCRKHFSNGA